MVLSNLMRSVHFSLRVLFFRASTSFIFMDVIVKYHQKLDYNELVLIYFAGVEKY